MWKLISSFCLVIILSTLTFSGFTQQFDSKFELQLYGIPYYKSSNYFYENIMQKKSDYFKLDYSERINQEFGINLKYNHKKWKFGIGVSYNTFNNDHSLYYVDFDNRIWQDLSLLFHQELRISTIGFGLLAEKEIFKTIHFGMRVSINGSNINEISEPVRNYSFGNNGLELKEWHSQGIKTFVIPEIYLSKTIYKGLDLIAGYKLKFYRRYKFASEEIYSITINSIYDYEPLYKYAIDTYQVGIYFGASYTFHLPKLRKSKVE